MEITPPGKSITKNTIARSFLLAIISSTLFMLLVLTIFTPVYEINDDVFLNLILNGYYTGTPSPFIFNMSAFAGYFFVTLYRFIPTVNWYGVTMYICIWVSLMVALFSVFHSFKTKNNLIAGLCFIIIFYLHFITSLTFTFVAALVAASGFILLVYAHHDNIRYKKTFYTASFVLLFLSNLIRRGSLDMIFALSVPTLAILLVTNQKNRMILLTYICVLAITILGLRSFNLKLYPTTPAWDTTMKAAPFNNCYYSPIFCQYETQESAYRKVGWSKNDYHMLMSFFYDDEQIFSSDKGQILKKNLDLSRGLSTALQQFGYHFLVITVLSFLYIQTVGLFVGITGRTLSKHHLVAVGITSLTAVMYIAFFVFRGYLPVRFAVSILYFVGIVTITPLYTGATQGKQPYSIRDSILIFFFIFFTLALLVVQIEISIDNRRNQRIFKQIYHSLPANKNDVTLVWGSSLPYEWQHPLADPSYIKDRNIIIGAWTQQTVYNDTIKQRFKIKNMFTDLYENPHVYLVASEYQQNLLKVFMKEHYQQGIGFRILKDFKEYGFPTKLVKVYKTP